MAESANNNHERKALSFFARAKEVAQQGNYDYAIEMFLEGLEVNPDDVTYGHMPLREMALKRAAKKGKKPSMVEKMKHMGGKTPLQQMLNAEYLLAKAPDHIPFAQAMLKGAYKGGYVRTAKWMADLLLQAANASDRPSAADFILLKDAYSTIGQYDRAIIACKKASQLKPQDATLDDEFKRLSAEMTMAKGKYDQEGDFTQSIKDAKGQQKIQASEGVVRSDYYRDSMIDDARKQLAQDPDSAKNVLELANKLAQTETDENEAEAIKLLEDYYTKHKDFSFKKRSDEVKITQLKRQLRHIAADPKAAAAANQLKNQLKQAELTHWQDMVAQYPTDLRAKYEYGMRLIGNAQYDEAIPLFQDAQRDPRRKIASMARIGQCFFKKGWTQDAAEIFQRAIEIHEIKDDAIAKDLQYNLGLCFELQGENEKAIDIFRKIAQVDFGYRDVSKRVDELRKKMNS